MSYDLFRDREKKPVLFGKRLSFWIIRRFIVDRRFTYRLAIAVALIGFVLPASFAEEQPEVAGYVAMSVEQQDFLTPPDIERFAMPLMRDPQAEEPPEPTSMPKNEIAGNVTTTRKTLTRIAVVPHDYKGKYGETAFDSRLGSPDCKMKGVYATCVYIKEIEY